MKSVKNNVKLNPHFCHTPDLLSDIGYYLCLPQRMGLEVTHAMAINLETFACDSIHQMGYI